MKDINNYIIERKGSNFKNFRYCISFSYKSGGWDKILTDDWKTEIRKEPLSSAEYWDVMDMHNNFASPESLVAWHGKGGYWANVYVGVCRGLRQTKEKENYCTRMWLWTS